MQDLGLKLSFDVKSGQLKTADNALKETAQSTQKAKKNTDKLTESTKFLGVSVDKVTQKLAVFSLALNGIREIGSFISEPLKEVIALNSEMENLTASLATLINVNHQNVTTTGRALNSLEKFTLSGKIANATLNELKETGLKLGYGFSDTAEMFKAFYATAGRAMSLTQAKEALGVLASAGRIAGVSVDALKVSLDNVGAGMANSATDFGRFIASQGLSTEAMQKARREGKLYELILEKLGPLASSAGLGAESYAISMEKLKDALAGLKGDAGAEFFEASKENIRATSEFLNQYRAEILETLRLLYDFLKSVYELFKEVIKAVASTFGAILGWSDNAREGISGVAKAFYVLHDLIIGIEYVFKNVTNTFKLLVENTKMDLKLMVEYFYRVKHLFTRSEGENLAQIRAEIRGHAEESNKIFSEYGRLIDEAGAKMQRIRQKSPAPKATDLNFEGLREIQAPALSTQASKKPYDAELILERKRAELMEAGMEQKLALERANHALNMQNMRYETEARAKNHELTRAQANELLALEQKLHQKRMQDIAEMSEANQALKNGLQEAFTGLFSGKQKNLFKSFTQSLQASMTKMFTASLTKAILQSSVAEGMKNTFSNAFNGISGIGKASGGLVNASGARRSRGGALGGIGGALGAFATGSALGGIAGNLLSTPQNEDRTQKYGTLGAGIGTAIGYALGGPVAGAIIGSLAGSLVGSFKSEKTSITGAGVQIAKASKKYLSGSEFVDKKKESSSFWGLSSGTKYWTQYSAINRVAAQGIKNTLRGFEYILQDLGAGIKELSVSAGRYKDYASIAGAGAREMIREFLNIGAHFKETSLLSYLRARKDNKATYSKVINGIRRYFVESTPALDSIYNLWSEYAKSLNTEVAKLISESLGKYLKTGYEFKSWLLKERGDELGALRFESELAKKQVSRLLETLGAQNVNIDNYLSWREQALKENFSHEHIENINRLGEALKASTQAAKKYEEALKNEKKSRLNLVDSYLKKTRKLEDLRADSGDTLERLQVGMLTTLKAILRTQQEILNGAQPRVQGVLP